MAIYEQLLTALDRDADLGAGSPRAVGHPQALQPGPVTQHSDGELGRTASSSAWTWWHCSARSSLAKNSTVCSRAATLHLALDCPSGAVTALCSSTLRRVGRARLPSAASVRGVSQPIAAVQRY